MKKLCLAITTLLLINLYTAQNQDRTYKPQIYPVSPAVAELGKYGNYPVDLSSGLPQIEIPLYTVKSGNIEFPVKLMYHASGIKTGQESSWVGLGWSLSPGGQVNVDIRDTPDENETGVYNVPNVDAVINYMTSYPNNHIAFKANYLNKSWVKDAYQIQLPTVNGEFYRGGANDNDLKFPKDDYRVKWNTGINLVNDGPLEITDTKGARYYFKEEEKATKANNPGQETYTSAYLLTKMLLNEDVIDIKYQNQFDIIPFYNYSQSQTFTKTITYNQTASQESLGPVTNQMFTNLPMVSKKTSEIIFKDGRLRFILGQNFGRYAGKYLEQIIVEKKVGSNYETVKFINFHYSLFNGAYSANGEQGRLRLDKVEEESAGEVLILADLHYNNNVLPTLDSFSQDYFGYYNGVNNQNLIPKTYIKPNTFFGSANREVNTGTNQNGILKEIVYPTKGKTVFEYETNTFYGKSIHGEYSSEPISIGNLILNSIGQGSNIPQTGHFDFDNTPPTNYCNQGIQQRVIGGNTGTNCPGGYCCEGRKYLSYNMQNYPTAKLLIDWYITNTNPEITVSKYAYAKIIVTNHGNIVFEKTSRLTGSGTFEVDVTQGDISCSISVWGETIYSGVSMKLAVPNSVAENNQLAGGLRVVDITNYDSDGTFVNKKSYDYNIPGTTKSSGKLVNQNSSSYNMYWDNGFTYHYSNNECCSTNQGCNLVITDTYYRTMGSNSNGGAFKHNLMYEYVTERDVDQNGNNKGSRVVKYNVVPDIVIDSKSSLIMQDNKYKRNLSEETIYDSNNIPLKKIKNMYIEDSSKASVRKDFKVFMHKDTNVLSGSCALNDAFSLAGSFEVVGSTINIPRQLLRSQEETSYFGTDSVISKKEFFSESPNTVNTSKEIGTYADNNVLTTIYQYAHEKGNQLMIDKNMIGIPLEIESTKTIGTISKVLSKVETFYPTVLPTAQTGNLVLPTSVMSYDLQNIASTEITYDQYDSKGNLQQYTTKDGIVTSIIWGYNSTHPIAKISGATYAQVSLLAADIISASNADIDAGTEQTLIGKLDVFRKESVLQNAQVTTYTYDPLIGVTSITPPSGIREVYLYDSANRLKEIRQDNATGKLIKEFKYNYKP